MRILGVFYSLIFWGIVGLFSLMTRCSFVEAMKTLGPIIAFISPVAIGLGLMIAYSEGRMAERADRTFDRLDRSLAKLKKVLDDHPG